MPKLAIEYVKTWKEFNAETFEGITGLKEETTKKITIDGKEIEISQESFDELKKSLLK